jgi:uracil-DNA glycosylase family 4
MAATKRRAFLDWQYWGRPVPNFGDPTARLLIVGLAPAAHGANRTGRMFQARSQSRDDGLVLIDCAITAVCHCAPPENKPTPQEISNCRPWFVETIDMLPVRVFLALGQIAWKATLDQIIERGWYEGRRPKFAHGAQVALGDHRWLLASYHPSQQNTFTGKLTQSMFDGVFRKARKLLQNGG